MKARTLIVLIGFAVVIGGEAAAETRLAGKVQQLKGTASAASAGEIFSLAPGAEVFAGDTVSTDENSRVELLMVDESTITLSDETIFVIEDYLFDADANTGNAVLKLTRGAFRAVTGLIVAHAPKRFTVDTPYGTIGVRAADFWASTLDEEVNVILLEGESVVVENDAGRVEITEAGHATTIKSATSEEDGAVPTQKMSFSPGAVGGRRSLPMTKGLTPARPVAMSADRLEQVRRSVSFE